MIGIIFKIISSTFCWQFKILHHIFSLCWCFQVLSKSSIFKDTQSKKIVNMKNVK